MTDATEKIPAQIQERPGSAVTLRGRPKEVESLSAADTTYRSGYAGRTACSWCGEEMEADRETFCSEGCMDEAARSNPCIYCGAAADTVDHVIPQSRRPD